MHASKFSNNYLLTITRSKNKLQLFENMVFKYDAYTPKWY